jgi:hypothetical protein
VAESPWFWLAAVAVLGVAAAASGPYRRLALRVRRAAVRRGAVSLPPGRDLRADPVGGAPDLSWLAYLVALWVAVGPWTWGYDDVAGAVTTDLVTGGCVALLALGAILLPALWALETLAGLWLVTAPWVVGYGDANGPVGLSDSLAGVVLIVAALSGLGAASRSLRPGSPGALGRTRSRDHRKPPDD